MAETIIRQERTGIDLHPIRNLIDDIFELVARHGYHSIPGTRVPSVSDLELGLDARDFGPDLDRLSRARLTHK
jgi:hypothetical protein